MDVPILIFYILKEHSHAIFTTVCKDRAIKFHDLLDPEPSKPTRFVQLADFSVGGAFLIFFHGNRKASKSAYRTNGTGRVLEPDLNFLTFSSRSSGDG